MGIKKKEPPRAANVTRRKQRERNRPKSKSIIMFLGREVKEYEEKRLNIIKLSISKGELLCEKCLRPLAIHSSYPRGIKETGETIRVTIVWCNRCRIWHAVLPDFLLRNKHYSGNEVESVIIDGETTPIDQIDTKASASTIRRWLKQICGRIVRAVGKLKYHFGREGRSVNEVKIDAGFCYSELEQVLEMAPHGVKYSGNKLGLANIWLRTCGVAVYI